jgi:hypothetical protein
MCNGEVRARRAKSIASGVNVPESPPLIVHFIVPVPGPESKKARISLLTEPLIPVSPAGDTPKQTAC